MSCSLSLFVGVPCLELVGVVLGVLLLSHLSFLILLIILLMLILLIYQSALTLLLLIVYPPFFQSPLSLQIPSQII